MNMNFFYTLMVKNEPFGNIYLLIVGVNISPNISPYIIFCLKKSMYDAKIPWWDDINKRNSE